MGMGVAPDVVEDLLKWLNGEDVPIPDDTLESLGAADKVALLEHPQENYAESQNRVEDLLLRCQALQSLVESCVGECIDRSVENEADRQRDSINDTLSAYRVHSELEISYDPATQRHAIKVESSYRWEIPWGESLAVDAITEIIDAGLVAKVQRCRCDKWFFALRLDQKSCSARCRLKLFESTPGAKQKRKEYMKNYYQLKKSGKVK